MAVSMVALKVEMLTLSKTAPLHLEFEILRIGK